MIGGFFALVAVMLSVIVIAVRRASLRFDRWLLRKIPLQPAGIQFYCAYALVLSLGLTVLAMLLEVGLVGAAAAKVAGGALLFAVGLALVLHRRSLQSRGILLLKRQPEEVANP